MNTAGYAWIRSRKTETTRNFIFVFKRIMDPGGRRRYDRGGADRRPTAGRNVLLAPAPRPNTDTSTPSTANRNAFRYL